MALKTPFPVLMSPHFHGAIPLKSMLQFTVWSQGTEGSGSGDEAGGEEDYEEEEEENEEPEDGGTEGSGDQQGALYKCLEIALFWFRIGSIGIENNFDALSFF